MTFFDEYHVGHVDRAYDVSTALKVINKSLSFVYVLHLPKSSVSYRDYYIVVMILC